MSANLMTWQLQNLISSCKRKHFQQASVEDFPLMMQQQAPRWSAKLEAFVDIVQAAWLQQ